MGRHVRHLKLPIVRRGLVPLLVLLCLILSQIATIGPAASVSVAHAAGNPVISTVLITGSAANPTFAINGSNFGSAPSAAPATCTFGSGFDYGTALHINDSSNNPHAFDAGLVDPSNALNDYICLDNLAYTGGTQISFTFNTYYTSLQPPGYYQLNAGDAFTLWVEGVPCSGTVNFGTVVSCAPPTLTSVAFDGTSSPPTVTVIGSNLGSQPSLYGTQPNVAFGCNPSSGSNYAYQQYGFYDTTVPWGSGQADPTGGTVANCIGISFTSYSATQVAFKFGNAYGTNGWTLFGGDTFTVYVAGAQCSGTVNYSTAVICASSPGNLTWTNATLLTPNITATADQVLDQAGQSRWYKFAVQPNTQVTVTLTNVPAEYDLTLYKDINSTYNQIAGPQSLTLASAQDVPDHFAPDHFAPDHLAPDHLAAEAFAPDHLAPDHFAADVFAPDHLAPDHFAPDHLAPDHLAPDAYAPDHLAPDAFAPDHLAPDHLAPDHLAQDNAFTSAQTRSLIGISAFPGTIGQGISANTWLNSGFFYIRVRGSNGAFDPATAFHLSVTQPNGACASFNTNALPPTSITAPAGGYKTIVLTNPGRMSGSAADKLALFGGNGALQTFGQRADVLAATSGDGGVNAIVDVSTDARVAAAYALADDPRNITCPAAQNAVADAIKAIVTAYRQQNPGLQYVVIVGDDHVIPFFRHPDQASLGSESTFTPPVQDNSAAQASLKLDYTLSQDDYGASTSLAVNVDQFPIPQLAVGRLVQTPAEVSGMLAAYIATNGVVSPGSSLVTGYDFLQPVASAVQGVLQAGTGTTPDTLIEDRARSPQDPSAWNADQLRSALLNKRHDIMFLAGHFSQSTALAADYTTRIFSTDIANPAVIAAGTFKNAIVFSNGCHSGYGVDSADDVPSLTLEPNWPEAFAQTQATLIAGTGYQYGDSDFIKYSESIYLDFSRQLLAGSGAVPIGNALNLAKQQYLAETPQLNGIEAKSVLEITLYGLPMLGVNMPAGRTTATSDPSIVTSTTAAAADPGQSRGLSSADVVVTPILTAKTVALTNIDATASPTPTPATATYLVGSKGDVVVEPAQPILPLETRNVSVPNTTLRGIGFRGGDYSDTPNILPFTGAATTELRGVHPFFQSDVLFPIKPWSANYFGALTNPSNPTTRLNVIAAQYRSDGPSSSTGTLRQYGHMNFRLFYSDYTGNAAGSSAPFITLVSAAPSAAGASILFNAHVADDPSAGVQAVWVTYTSTAVGPFAGQWMSLDLTQDPADSTLWTGALPIPAGADPTTISYMVQATSGTGLVSLDTNGGAYYTPASGSTPTPLAATMLTLSAPPTTGAYGGTATFNASLTLSGNGAAVSGQPVAITLGSQTAEAITRADGSATVAVKLSDQPGAYQPVLIFAGTGALAPSGAQNVPSFNETPQSTSLALVTPSGTIATGNDSGMSATLTDGNGATLSARTVVFLLTNSVTAQTYSLSTPTDASGRAVLGAVPVAPGSYTVSASFGGSVTLPQGTVALNDPSAIPSSASVTVTLTDPDYASATTSGPLTIAPTVNVSSSAPSGSAYGQAVTFTALVGPSITTANGILAPTGTVAFYDRSASSPITCAGAGDGALSGGKATCTIGTLSAGPHSIAATYAGDSVFPRNTSAALSQNVTPAPLTIAANNLTKVYGANLPVFTASYSGFVNGDTAATLTAQPTLTTTAGAASGVGGYPITAGGAVDTNYSISYRPGTLTITQAAQAIGFGSLPNRLLGQPPFTVSATGGGSGNPVIFSAGPSAVCTSSGANGTTITLIGVGACTVTANQPGNANYQAAAPVARSFTVSYPPLYMAMAVTSSPPGPVTTGSTVTDSFVLGNHTATTQTVSVKATLTYTGSRGSLTLTIPVAITLKAGQTINQSVSFPITKSFPRGTYTLTLAAKDGSGDTATSSAALTVV